MPVIIKPEEMSVHRQGRGWTETTLADRGSFGAPAMVARRISFESHASGPEFEHGDYEEMLYVIRGGGAAIVGEKRFELAPESLLWLEPEDRCRFEAGPEGLEILQGYAPGE
jgi:quercetin dioxygenase-like cupin family protein